MTDFYSLLNIASDADEEAVRGALRRMLRLWTNRTNAPDLDRRQEAERIVKRLEEAEERLLDAQERSRYDAELANQPKEARQVDDADLGDKEDLVREGWRLLIAGSVADALYVATKATEIDGANADAWALLGQARYRWGDIDDAIYEYKRAIKIRPNEASFYFDLATVYESAERLPEALTQYERAAKTDPTSTMYRAAVGALLVNLQRYDRAIELLEHCVSEDADNASYSWFLAIAYTDRAYENWTFVPEGGEVQPGHYATRRSHVTEARKYVHKALNLKFDDRDLFQQIEGVRKNIEEMEERKFHGNRLAAIAAIVFGVVTLHTVIGALWFLGGGIAYLYAARVPQYILNRRVLEGKGGTSADWLAGLSEGEGGCVALCIGLLLICGLIPIMAAYNYYLNYKRNA